MPHIKLLEDVPGIGKADTTRALTAKAAAALVKQGKAQYLDFTGQPIAAEKPAAQPPVPAVPVVPEPLPSPASEEGKTTDDADNPSLQDSVPDTGTQPRKLRKKSF